MRGWLRGVGAEGLAQPDARRRGAAVAKGGALASDAQGQLGRVACHTAGVLKAGTRSGGGTLGVDDLRVGLDGRRWSGNFVLQWQYHHAGECGIEALGPEQPAPRFGLACTGQLHEALRPVGVSAREVASADAALHIGGQRLGFSRTARAGVHIVLCEAQRPDGFAHLASKFESAPLQKAFGGIAFGPGQGQRSRARARQPQRQRQLDLGFADAEIAVQPVAALR